MAEDQKDQYIQYLAEQNQVLRLTGDAMKLVLEDFMAQMKDLKDQMSSMQSRHADLENCFSEEHKLRKSAERKIKSLQERLDYANQERFGDRRQKIKSKAKTCDSDRQKEKDDYDGTDDTLRTDSVGNAHSQEVKEPSFPSAIFFYENGSCGREVLTDFAERFSEILKELFMRVLKYDDVGLSPKERFLSQRNNSLHYGNDAGAEMAATYHSVIGTVKLHGSSIWNFIGTFFKNIFNGCRDYVNMVPGKITLATSHC